MGDPAPKACHNCRRRRLKCDRALPTCQKCEKHEQDCLGYGKLYLWNRGVASRGRMMGKTFPAPGQADVSGQEVAIRNGSTGGLSFALLDPLYQGMDDSSRRYLFHFATNLSGDMAICDITDINPFRSLVPLCQYNPILLHAINANAALHVSCLHRRGEHTSHTTNSSQAMVDALSAKHKSLVLLRQALENAPQIDVDVMVAVVHLFIIFELISPGGDEWRAHVQGALRLISYLHTLPTRPDSPAAFVRDTITSDCLTYYVLGCTLMNTSPAADAFHPFIFNDDIVAALTRAELNSYLSLPTPLLRILFRATELSNAVASSAYHDVELDSTAYLDIYNRASTLLTLASSFNVTTWASALEGTSASARTTSRIHTALAHQAALKIYICRSVDSLIPLSYLGQDTKVLVENVIGHLSNVGVDDPIFMATCWPSFIAGAETDDTDQREWVLDRLERFWACMPWGYVRTAEEVMRTTWALRDGSGKEGKGNEVENGSGSWVQQLKGLERYWLIA